MITLDLLKAKWPEILRISARYGADHIRVFGSVARGEMTAQSDLDLLVRLAPGRTLLDLIAIKQEVEDLLGYPVDVVTEASLSPYIRDQVLIEARPLF
ncbi:MAG: nucleotidyltransferase family protein [Blastocatellia bacterium]